MPAVSSDPSGDVNISWFDSRRSPTNPDVLNIFATYTKDNGASFAKNMQVNGSHITASAGDFIGDYSGIAFGQCTVTHCPHGTPACTSAGLNEGGMLNVALLQTVIGEPDLIVIKTGALRTQSPFLLLEGPVQM